MTPKSLLGALRFKNRGRSRSSRDGSASPHSWASAPKANASLNGATIYRDGELLPTMAEMDAFLSERVFRGT
jgi:hypothetical protein